MLVSHTFEAVSENCHTSHVMRFVWFNRSFNRVYVIFLCRGVFSGVEAIKRQQGGNFLSKEQMGQHAHKSCLK